MVEKLVAKAVQLGLGIADITREEVEKFVGEVVKDRDANTREGRKLVDDLLRDAEAARKKLEARIDKRLKKMLGKTSFATKSDIARLEKKIDALKRKR